MYTNLKSTMFIKNKLLWRVDKMPNAKKEKPKIWSEEAIDTLIDCFQSHECIWNITSVDLKDRTGLSLPLEEFDMSVQEYNINKYDYKNAISEANSYYFHKSAPP